MIITHEIVKEHIDNTNYQKLNSFYKKYNYEYVYESTKHLKAEKEDSKKDRDERLYLLYHGILEIPKCSVCEKPVNFISFNRGYFKYCCLSCSSTGTTEDRTKTTRKKHGENFYSEDAKRRMNNRTEEQKEQQLQKSRQTCLEKYGTTDVLNRPEIREKYIQNRKENLDKIIQKTKDTCLKRYGVHSVALLPEVAEKKRETCRKRFDGYDYSWQHPDVKKKIRSTFFKKYGVHSPFALTRVRKKREKTMISLYGNTNALCVPEFLKKQQETMLNKYGTTTYPFKTYSKISQELFWELFNKLPEQLKESCYFAEHNNETFLSFRNKEGIGKCYFYDFSIMSIKLFIEFQGDYWHRNPEVYDQTKEDVLDIRKAEEDKIRLAEENGFDCILVWEKEYRGSRESVIEKLLNVILSKSIQDKASNF
jgi:very-short-patch-repair endonuclease